MKLTRRKFLKYCGISLLSIPFLGGIKKVVKKEDPDCIWIADKVPMESIHYDLRNYPEIKTTVKLFKI